MQVSRFLSCEVGVDGAASHGTEVIASDLPIADIQFTMGQLADAVRKQSVLPTK